MIPDYASVINGFKEVGIVKVFQGQLHYYRIYDVGSEVDLKAALEILNQKNLTEQFKLKRPSRSLVIDEAPIVIFLGSIPYEILGRHWQLQASGKLWNFGSLSIMFKFIFPEEIPISEFKTLAHLIENDDRLDSMAKDTAYKVIRDLGDSIKFSGLWSQFEDYIIFNLDPHVLKGEKVASLLDTKELYELILTELEVTLSDSVTESIKANSVQYSENDLAVIDWNSALICSHEDARDFCDVIEFGLCQSLEMRYYDEKLDKKLSTLYRAVQENQSERLFSSSFKQLAKDAALFYIEISEVKEKIINSLKVTGDIHYAKIYRMALERLRLKDWNQSVEEKLDNLKEIALIFQSEVQNKRSLLLEITIVALIAVEVVPVLYNLIF